MDNYDISKNLGMYAKLLELYDENPFKAKAFAAAAFNLKKIKDPLSEIPETELDKVPGVGKTVLSAVKSMIQTGNWPDLDAIVSRTPPGVLQMLAIKGLGPKKVGIIWKQMGLETVEELFDACRENRLVELSGFGLKTQGEVMRAIEFSWNAKGKFHFARMEKPAQELILSLRKQFPGNRFEFTGEFRRCCDVVDRCDIITTIGTGEIQHAMEGRGFELHGDNYTDAAGFAFAFSSCAADTFDRLWFETSATPEHLEEIGYKPDAVFTGEVSLYTSLGFPYIEPEMREGTGEALRMKQKPAGRLLEFSDLKGVLHNHTTWSDGLHSTREMAEYCRELGYEYLGICDHSRSAAYAGGLDTDRVVSQWAEIDALNKELAPFKILKGIESDILADGSLDYDTDILAGFDLVVASVHSNLKMDQEKATNRIARAIENPYTHILGHPTGRLLLMREGYPLDHKFIIDACAANGVCIEINANPFRLDLDWRWVAYAMEKGVMLSINPDAHEKSGFHDMYYGTISARKGGLTPEMTLNAYSLDEFETWLRQKRSASLAR